VVSAPASVRLRAYQVGFGDCLLLTIRYSDTPAGERSERHVLIDYGTKSGAQGGPSLAKLAPKIAEHCGGHLDAVVVTHRHADHVGGFGGDKAMRHLAPLQPGLIIRPWTDGPAEALAPDGQELGARSHRFLALLDEVAVHQRSVVEEFGVDGRTTAGRVGQLAALSVANQDSLDMLGTWTVPDPTVWVRADDKLNTQELLPGVGVRVLGPPTLEQVPKMRSYASSSADYWLAMTDEDQIGPELKRADADEVWTARDLVAVPGGLGSAGWLVDKMHRASTRQALEIVAGFDDVLNNTSVILLLTIGDRSVLLAGDAQVENWSYALDRARGENGRRAEPDLRAALASVELYKVGHHGSRNATPRRLVDLWRSERNGRKLCSVLSTKDKVFDKTVEGTVPKPELVNALKALGPVRNTDELPEGVWWFDVEAPAQGPTATWAYTEGPMIDPPSPDPRDDDDGDAD
jgi:hypothetical protein